MVWEKRTAAGRGRTVGTWVESAILSGELSDWPRNELLPATLEALYCRLHISPSWMLPVIGIFQNNLGIM